MRSFSGGSRGDRDVSAFEKSKRTLGDTASRTYEGITEKAGSAVDKVSNVAGSAYESVTGTVNNVYTGAEDLASEAFSAFSELWLIASAHDGMEYGRDPSGPAGIWA